MAATVRDDITSYFTTNIQPNAIPTLENELLMYRLGEPKMIPRNAGDTVQVNIYPNLTSSTVPVSELVGGFANSSSPSNVTMRVRFFANDVQFSKLTDVINQANWRESQFGRCVFNAAETADLLARDALSTIPLANTQFVNDRASAATFVATDTLNVDEVNQAVTTLDVANVKTHRLTPGRYPLVLHGRVVGDMKGDTGGGSNPNALTWYDFARRQDPTAFEAGRVGSVMGAEVLKTNACPRFTTGGAGGTTIYYEGFMVGDNLFMTGAIGDLPNAPDSINAGRPLIHLIPPARTAATPHDNLWIIAWDFYGAAGLIDGTRGVDLFAASNA